MLRQFLPRLALAVLLFLGAIFTYSESIYLQEQAAEIGPDAAKIAMWMWVFRVVTLAFAIGSVFILGITLRRFMNS